MSRIAVIALTLLIALSGPVRTSADEFSATVRFSGAEISIILGYYRQHSHSNNKNAKHKMDLPPGIAKNLGRGKPLPPGIAKRMLPSDLISELPPTPNGFELIVVAGKVLLVEIATQIVHDILEDALLS